MKVNIWRRKMVVSGKADTKFCKVVKRYRESFSNLSKFENVQPIRRNVSKSLISTLMIFKKNAKKNKPILCESSMETIASNEDLSTYEDMTLNKLKLNAFVCPLNRNKGFNQSLQDVILEAREELRNRHLDQIDKPMYIVFNRAGCKDEMSNGDGVYEEFDFRLK